jgi:hypothetical protein
VPAGLLALVHSGTANSHYIVPFKQPKSEMIHLPFTVQGTVSAGVHALVYSGTADCNYIAPFK